MSEPYSRFRAARAAALRYSQATGQVAYVAHIGHIWQASSTRPLAPDLSGLIYETRYTRDGWRLV